MIEYYEINQDGTKYQLVYWELREIRFTKAQVKWLLPFLPILKAGKYPPQPVGYGGNPETRSHNSSSAGFTKPVEIAAEIEARIQQTGIDGLLTLGYYTWGMASIELMHYVSEDENRVWDRIGSVLRFCSGNQRKKLSYRGWKDQETGWYYRKNSKTLVKT